MDQGKGSLFLSFTLPSFTYTRLEPLHRLCDGSHKVCIEQQYHHLDLIDLLRELIMIPQLLNEDALPEGQQENEAGNGNRENANENVDAGHQGNQWWGIVKENQMIVFGFITLLLPGFHNID